MIRTGTPSPFTTSTAFIAGIGTQLAALDVFAQATTIAEAREAWPGVEQTLRLNGQTIAEAGPPPHNDATVPAFKTKIMDSVCPSLNRGITKLLQEPSNLTVSMLKHIKPNDIPSCREHGVITTDVAELLISSARLYMNFGEQIDVVSRYMAATGSIDDELLRCLQLTFVFNGFTTELVRTPAAANPYASYNFKFLLRQKISLSLETRLITLLSTVTTRNELSRIHGITGEVLHRAESYGIISKTALVRVKHALGPEPVFGTPTALFRRYPATGIAVGATSAASLTGAAASFIQGGGVLLTAGLAATAIAIPSLAILLGILCKKRYS